MIALAQRFCCAEENGMMVTMDTLVDRLGVPSDLPELNVVKELCGDNGDIRNLKLVVKLSTEEDSLDTFLHQTFFLFDTELGEDQISKETLESLLVTLVFLTPKESKEAVTNITLSSNSELVSKSDLKDFLLSKKPNYVKVLSCWEGCLLGGLGDLLAMSANITKEMNRRMEKVAESGSCLPSAGKDVVSDVSASITASKEKVTDVLSSAVTSLHKRTGSKSETSDKKLD